jgi:predicted DNA-binding WGR domain protein
MKPVFTKTVYNQTDGSNKQYTVEVRKAPKGGFDVFALYGPIGGTQQETRKTARPLPNKMNANELAINTINSKLAKGYSPKLNSGRTAAQRVRMHQPPQKKVAAVRGPRTAVALTNPAPKVKGVDARLPKAVKKMPKVANANAVISSLEGLTAVAQKQFQTGQPVEASIEDCDRCKGTGYRGDNTCEYCDGSRKQVTIIKGLDGETTAVRRENVRFKK